ncbi:unnamed protein product, partial [Scytosiphon promiscuus]
KSYSPKGGARAPAPTSTDSHGVRGSALASDDEARLSNMRLQRWGPNSDVAPSNPASCPAPLEEEPEQHVDTTAAPSSTMIPHGFEHNRCVDVVTVALYQMCGEDSWYTSSKELQLASLQVCAACRSFTTLNLTVEHDASRNVLEPKWLPSLSRERMPSSRVPQLRPRRLTWNFATTEGVKPSMSYALTEAIAMKYGHDIVDLDDIYHFTDEPTPSFELRALSDGWRVGVGSAIWVRLPPPMEQVIFPASLQELTFGCYFNQRIDRVVWPASLKQLTFGRIFNQPIEKVVWPTSLQQLTFGNRFNYPIQRTQWPASLRRLEFGYFFDQAVEGVAWPDSLRQLSFGDSFNKPLEGAVMPVSLTDFTLGAYFNQPIERVTWPKAIGALSFGDDFNHPIEGVTWPDSIRELSFGDDFNHPIEGVKWPDSITELSFGDDFNHPIEGVTWPDSITELSFRMEFNQPIEGVIWPSSITNISFGAEFNQPVEGVTWPAGLEALSLGVDFDDRSSSFHLFELGTFDQQIDRARWPTSLRRLEIGGIFRQSLQELGKWMPNLEELRVVVVNAGGYRALLGGIKWPKRLSKLAV